MHAHTVTGTVPALFDIEPVGQREPERTEKLSAGTRLVQRQAAAIGRGVHPLGLVRPHLAIHPDAQPVPATKNNAGDRTIRCGTCIYREPGRYAKCTFGAHDVTYPGLRNPVREYPRAANSLATDVRSWWPGCTDWQGKP